MSYLDTKKSVIISSPAGSGKTEKLARRYIALLKEGAPVERILALTFTEKAAAEMKQRVLGILQKENRELLKEIYGKTPLMRISTIHAFCLKLLKRFSLELGLDPSLEVMDDLTARHLWSEAAYDELISEREHPSLFFHAMKSIGLRGLDSILRLLDALYDKRPEADFISEDDTGDDEHRRLIGLYRRCLKRYGEKKSERHLIDFSDLEVLAYEALSKGPEWHNILYCFDEHTDHILVDEFQDTSRLQWKIIDKLTEEWRSGMGAKRSSGSTPTIFLVGDEKQSIYLFRGADVSVFREAKKKFSEWLGEQYHFEKAKENFRSLPMIVDFTNSLFEKLMAPGLFEAWRTEYSPFEAVREGEGRVELIVLEGGENTKEIRAKEASVLAKNIKSLEGNYEIYDGGVKRPCDFSDMAVLLRERTHLAQFENALRRENIPFIVLKGMGFYDAPETAVLREFVYFIVDPTDDYSLLCLLRSPLFGIDIEALTRLRGLKHAERWGLLEKLGASGDERLREIFIILDGLIKDKLKPMAVLLEDVLVSTGGWTIFREKQRHSNVKKFIQLIESCESHGIARLEIREKLMRERFAKEVAKANIGAEGMNAVKIMTVHAAKGLQFPMVFLPSLDEKLTSRTGRVVLSGTGFVYEPDSSKKSKNAEFLRQKEKELEEEKRLFYVAVTRAMDFLSMTATIKSGDGGIEPNSRLFYIISAFGDGVIRAAGSEKKLPFEAIYEEDVYERLDKSFRIRLVESSPFMDEPVYAEPLPYEPDLRWRDVTEDIDIRAEHGKDWIVLGRVMHRVFEEISRGIMEEGHSAERARALLKEEAVTAVEMKRLSDIINGDVEKLREAGILKGIINPSENSFSELPFHLHLGKTVFKGRIDRLLLRDNTALIYDYKTFPVRDSEMPQLMEKYRFQMEIYRTAAERLFSVKARAFLLFTHVPLVVEIN